MPFPAISKGFKPVIGSPRKTTLPDDGGMTPEIRLKSVVFPAPFGPMIA
jgi:hypothetical protein